MSVSSMADMAYARRRDVAPEDTGLPTLDRIAEEKGQKPATATTASSALAAIAAYIPTEVLTVYVAILATFGVTVPSTLLPASSPGASPSPSPSPAAGAGGGDAVTAAGATPIELYLLFLILTPIVVWALYAAKARRAGKGLPGSVGAWPKWEMLAASVAFAVWAAALPSSPLGTFDWFNQALAGVIALIASMLLGVFAPLFASNALADN